MAHQWRGLIDEYRDRLPVTDKTPNVTLLEGGTPLNYACVISEMVGAQVWLKVDGANPTGSFKDRGMTVAISKAAERGAKADGAMVADLATDAAFDLAPSQTRVAEVWLPTPG